MSSDNRFDDTKEPLIEHDRHPHTDGYQDGFYANNANYKSFKDDSNQAPDAPHGNKDELLDQLVSQTKARIHAANLEKEAASETVPYSKIQMTYADRTDKLLMGFGYACAFITGAGMPSMMFIFGDILNSF